MAFSVFEDAVLFPAGCGAEALHLSGENIPQQVQGSYSFSSSEKIEGGR